MRPSVMSEFGPGSANFLLDEVTCTGYESALDKCYHNKWRQHDCRQYETAGVVCMVGKGRSPHGRNICRTLYTAGLPGGRWGGGPPPQMATPPNITQ